MSARPSPPSGRSQLNSLDDTRTLSDENVELDDLPDAQSNVPLEEDVMQLARLGEIGAIQKLFDSGKYDAKYTDDQGITPLHVRCFEGEPVAGLSSKDICLHENCSGLL